MRGVVFTGERGLALMDFPDPTPDAHDVVIEMKASGMCGTDLHQFRRPKGQTAVAGETILADFRQGDAGRTFRAD